MTAPTPAQVLAAIESLPLRLRKAFEMHLDGKSRDEIAAELHISVKRVDARLAKALRICRERTEKFT